MPTISELWRYPVKSMQGERIDGASLSASGFAGDRIFGLVDRETGHVASAKHPRKWANLMQYEARMLDDGAVEITLPDGDTVRSDASDVDAVLSSAIGREVQLVGTAPGDRHYEMLFPDLEDVAPQGFIDAHRTADENDGTLTDIALGFGTPPATFFDVTALHVMTDATLAAVGADVRRFRPNIVIAVDDDGYVENDWVGRTLALGPTATASVLLATMRCVMTTLPQPGLDADRGVLQTLARDNRVSGWASAGVYATPVTDGDITVGDVVTLAD